MHMNVVVSNILIRLTHKNVGFVRIGSECFLAIVIAKQIGSNHDYKQNAQPGKPRSKPSEQTLCSILRLQETVKFQ